MHVVPPRAEVDGQVLTVLRGLAEQLSVSKHAFAEEGVLRSLTLRHAAIGRHRLVALRLLLRVAEGRQVICGVLRGGVHADVRLSDAVQTSASSSPANTHGTAVTQLLVRKRGMRHERRSGRGERKPGASGSLAGAQCGSSAYGRAGRNDPR